MGRLNKISVFITGPTRSGTTFLLALFHYMGFYTGYADREVDFVQRSLTNAGLEYLIDRSFMEVYPYVIKHPASWVGGPSVFNVIDRRALEIQHMIVTTREHEALVKSNVVFTKLRRYRNEEDRSKQVEQEVRKSMPVVQEKLLAAIVERKIPYTVIEFPRMVQDREYLFNSIKHIRKVIRGTFDSAFDSPGL